MRSRIVLASTALVAALALPVAAQGADDVPLVPESCKLHPVHVVNPGCVPALTSNAGDFDDTLPNLVPDVVEVTTYRPLIFDPETGTISDGPTTLYFDTWAQNLGDVALQLTVSEPPVGESIAVSQCVSWVARACVEQAPVGGFSWHEPHSHWHFEDFATYELRRVQADGAIDRSSAGLVARSEKVSFCMIDSARVRDDVTPAVGTYALCTPTVQGISPGWADIYGPGLPGQNFVVDGLPDGRYALVVTVNGAGRLHETTAADNTVEVVLELADDLATVRILERRYP